MSAVSSIEPTGRPAKAGGAEARLRVAEELLAKFEQGRTNFHLGGAEDWTVSRETLRFLAQHVPEGASTLETGAGLSTVLFAALGARHICICPSEDEIGRIAAYCGRIGTPTSQIAFKAALSEEVLPNLSTPPLDLVLIDGGHGFPMPVIDWYFTAGKLRDGGVLVIDDTHLWSCGMLVDFLKQDAGWTSLGRIGRRTFAFRKTGPFSYQEFCYQPYVVRRSRVASLVTRALTAMDLILAGDLREFVRRAFSRG